MTKPIYLLVAYFEIRARAVLRKFAASNQYDRSKVMELATDVADFLEKDLISSKDEDDQQYIIPLINTYNTAMDYIKRLFVMIDSAQQKTKNKDQNKSDIVRLWVGAETTHSTIATLLSQVLALVDSTNAEDRSILFDSQNRDVGHAVSSMVMMLRGLVTSEYEKSGAKVANTNLRRFNPELYRDIDQKEKFEMVEDAEEEEAPGSFESLPSSEESEPDEEPDQLEPTLEPVEPDAGEEPDPDAEPVEPGEEPDELGEEPEEREQSDFESEVETGTGKQRGKNLKYTILTPEEREEIRRDLMDQYFARTKDPNFVVNWNNRYKELYSRVKKDLDKAKQQMQVDPFARVDVPDWIQKKHSPERRMDNAKRETGYQEAYKRMKHMSPEQINAFRSTENEEAYKALLHFYMPEEKLEYFREKKPRLYEEIVRNRVQIQRYKDTDPEKFARMKDMADKWMASVWQKKYDTQKKRRQQAKSPGALQEQPVSVQELAPEPKPVPVPAPVQKQPSQPQSAPKTNAEQRIEELLRQKLEQLKQRAT